MDPMTGVLVVLLGLLVFGLLVQFATFIAYHTVMALRDRDRRRSR